MVVSYLKEQGIEKLDYVIATHPHIDHIGGMDAVLETFPVGSASFRRKYTIPKVFGMC